MLISTCRHEIFIHTKYEFSVFFEQDQKMHTSEKPWFKKKLLIFDDDLKKNDFKKTLIKPLYNKGDKSDWGNFRLVCFL